MVRMIFKGTSGLLAGLRSSTFFCVEQSYFEEWLVPTQGILKLNRYCSPPPLRAEEKVFIVHLAGKDRIKNV